MSNVFYDNVTNREKNSGHAPARFSNQSALELKLQLLERRFTMPLSTILIPDGPKVAETIEQQHSAAPLQSINNHGSSTNSQHSFHFDSPSLSYHLLDPLNECERQTDSGSNTTRVEKRYTLIHPKPHSDTLDLFDSPIGRYNRMSDERSHVHVSLASQNSNHTVVTSHVQRKDFANIGLEMSTGNGDADYLDSKNKKESCGDSAGVIPPVADTAKSLRNMGQNSKRKAVPMKRATHSVKDSIIADALSDTAGRFICTTASLVVVGKNEKKHRVDPLRSSSIPGVDNNSWHGNDENLAPKEKINITKNKPDSYLSPLTLNSQNQLSRDNEKTNRHIRRLRTTTPVKSNSSMYDFFSSKQRRGSDTKQQNGDKMSEAKVLTDSGPVEKETQDTHLNDRLAELEDLRKKCQQLEQCCQDKDQQLKAIANNRTILDSALRTAVQQRDDEIKSLEREKETMLMSFRTELEKFVRRDANQQGRELRKNCVLASRKHYRSIVAP
jgi:hypothetical protein